MPDHITKAYDQDITALKTQLAEMGGIAEEQLANAIQALIKRDLLWPIRSSAMTSNSTISNASIEEKAILTIAKRQPMALDLREIMVAIRVSVRHRTHW